MNQYNMNLQPVINWAIENKLTPPIISPHDKDEAVIEHGARRLVFRVRHNGDIWIIGIGSTDSTIRWDDAGKDAALEYLKHARLKVSLGIVHRLREITQWGCDNNFPEPGVDRWQPSHWRMFYNLEDRAVTVHVQTNATMVTIGKGRTATHGPWESPLKEEAVRYLKGELAQRPDELVFVMPHEAELLLLAGCTVHAPRFDWKFTRERGLEGLFAGTNQSAGAGASNVRLNETWLKASASDVTEHLAKSGRTVEACNEVHD